jgi:hypothetical protein
METIKEETGRGGRRPGAGRPYLELHQEAERAQTKSITLTAREWAYLARCAPGLSPSNSIRLAVDVAGYHGPNGDGPKGWKG